MRYGSGRLAIRLLTVAATCVGAVSCTAFDGRDELSRDRAVHTVCGNGNVVLGIDVSDWQGQVDWDKVQQAGIGFAFARVSDGLSYKDTKFARNFQELKRVGIRRGAYQYFRPSRDARAQAELFVQTIQSAGGLEPADLPGVLDVETLDGVSAAQTLAGLDTWKQVVQQSTGRRVIIYSGSYFWDDNLKSIQYAGHPLWTAHYTTQSCPLVANPWTAWTFWQYTSTGTVAGVAGNVDRDRFNGTPAELAAFVAGSVLAGPDQGGIFSADGRAWAPDAARANDAGPSEQRAGDRPVVGWPDWHRLAGDGPAQAPPGGMVAGSCGVIPIGQSAGMAGAGWLVALFVLVLGARASVRPSGR